MALPLRAWDRRRHPGHRILRGEDDPCVWARIIDVPTNRHKELLKGMRTTLERLKAAAEAAVSATATGPALGQPREVG